jgi:AcrR family transcriptional regulator
VRRRARPRREPETTRDRLIRAAAEVFLDVGYDGARVVDIARKAGVTTGAIYSQFRDKADLLVKALGAQGVDAVGNVLLTNTELPVASMLRVLSEVVVEGELHPTEVLLLDAAVAARREPELREQLAGALGQRIDVLAAMIERARKERVVADDVSTEAVVRFLLILGFGSIVTRSLGLEAPNHAQWSRLIGRLLGGVAPTPPRAGGPRPRAVTVAKPRPRAV